MHGIYEAMDTIIQGLPNMLSAAEQVWGLVEGGHTQQQLDSHLQWDIWEVLACIEANAMFEIGR